MDTQATINKINQFLKLEKASILIAIFGSIIWILSFFIFFYFIIGDRMWILFDPYVGISPWDGIVACFLIVWIPTPLLSCVGMLSGGRYIWRKGFSWIAAIGIVLNLIWFAVYVTYGTLLILELS